jgi:hypothetical protein
VKIVSEDEVHRWFDAGHTYAAMRLTYQAKYGIDIVPSAFSNLRARRGWERRIVRDDTLIPWAVDAEHRWAYPVTMLRAIARQRAGKSVRLEDQARVMSWLRVLASSDEVVDYSPLTGFSYAPRRREVDHDLIREPERKTTTRRAII